MLPAKEKIKGLKYEISFHADAKEYSGRLNSLLAEFQQSHKEKGFRPGHVPLSVIKSKHGARIAEQAAARIASDAIDEYFTANGISPASSPEISITGLSEESGVNFDVKFEILPKIKPVDIEKISIERPFAKPSDKETGEAIKNIAASRHTSFETDRAAKKGDIAVIDFTGSVDGREFNGGTGRDYPLELGSGAFVPGFEDQIIGAKKGDAVEADITFPKDYGVQRLAGKKASFKVLVKSVREKTIPAVDDKFAKDLGRENLADLREYVSSLLVRRYDKMSDEIARQRVLKLLAKEKTALPESLVEREIEFMMRSSRPGSARLDPAAGADAKAEEKERKALRPEAEIRVRLGLVIADIGRRNNIEASQSDIDRVIADEAMRHPGAEQKTIDQLRQNRDALRAIAAEIFEKKTMDLILSKVKTKAREVSPDALEKTAKEEK
ncbi:MAG: trigger factor [Rickettsiales bacterium]|jgi:trigger factor|nr:trigger factor [Rickettsiales bacterium]